MTSVEQATDLVKEMEISVRGFLLKGKGVFVAKKSTLLPVGVLSILWLRSQFMSCHFPSLSLMFYSKASNTS